MSVGRMSRVERPATVVELPAFAGEQRSSASSSAQRAAVWICFAVAPPLAACSSGAANDCGTMEVDGDLFISTAADVELARGVASVSGNVRIGLNGDDPGPRDLSFLGCLAHARALLIQRAPGLETTAGANRLTDLDSLRISGPEQLERIEGFEGLDEIEEIYVPNAPAVLVIDLAHLENAGKLQLGTCDNPPNDPLFTPKNSALLEIGPFESLRSLKELVVASNTSLTRLSVLKSLHDNGAPPIDIVGIGNNPQLPQSELDADLAALGVEATKIESGCGNLGSEEKLCTCQWEE